MWPKSMAIINNQKMFHALIIKDIIASKKGVNLDGEQYLDVIKVIIKIRNKKTQNAFKQEDTK